MLKRICATFLVFFSLLYCGTGAAAGAPQADYGLAGDIAAYGPRPRVSMYLAGWLVACVALLVAALSVLVVLGSRKKERPPGVSREIVGGLRTMKRILDGILNSMD